MSEPEGAYSKVASVRWSAVALSWIELEDSGQSSALGTQMSTRSAVEKQPAHQLLINACETQLLWLLVCGPTVLVVCGYCLSAAFL